jgi:hypothetical protein
MFIYFKVLIGKNNISCKITKSFLLTLDAHQDGRLRL